MSDIIKNLLSRPQCVLFGCNLEECPACDRCGVDLYDADFIQVGWLSPITRTYWRVYRAVRRLFPRNCDYCGKRYWCGPKHIGDIVCSEECHDKWLPF